MRFGSGLEKSQVFAELDALVADDFKHDGRAFGYVVYHVDLFPSEMQSGE